ncbi:MAG: porin [Pseudomonadota bacterium]
MRDNMKKVLLGTSAIALASAFATSANSAEWDVKVGGFMEQHVAFASSDVDGLANTDFDGIDAKQDAEIIFKPTITLDNGLKIGADVQLEANTNGDQIDESFLFIDGSFGRVQLGSENSAGYTMTFSAPDVSFVGVNSNSLGAFVPYSGTVGGLNVGDDLFRGTLGSTFLENDLNNDAQRITYFTPRFAGFQVGLSYARDANQDSNDQIDCNNITCNYFDIGANYVNSFGPVDVAVSGRWGIGVNDAVGAENPQVWATGLNIGFGGITVGGSFGEQNNSSNGLEDGIAYDAGISYETGPWGFSFTYFHGENVDDEIGSGATAAAFANDEETDFFLLAGTYDLAKGVKLQAFGAYVDFDEDTGDAGGPNAANGDDVDGFIVGTGIKISF